MNSPTLLLQRLDKIAQSLQSSSNARALLGLGSVGIERNRLDEYSDLDFFVIVKNGTKNNFINDLSWLSSVSPIGFHFQNTKDGHKVLFDDGIYCEFAVFDESEMPEQFFSTGKIIWKEKDFDESLCIPRKLSAPQIENLDWAIGEAVTNIYVGLCRYARGEKLSGTRFIQNYAVDRLIACSSYFEKEHSDSKDNFQNERRYEQRFPEIAKRLPSIIQGYERCSESALALLQLIEELVPVNPVIKREIEKLANQLK